jgi:hypothetical protein
VLACACGGRLRFIATIEDPVVVQRILRHVGLPTEAPEPGPPDRRHDPQLHSPSTPPPEGRLPTSGTATGSRPGHRGAP